MTEGDGVDANDIATYQGDIGILINTRDLVKKGYNPTKVNVSTTASQGDYDQQLDVDSFTNIAKLALAIEDLTEAAESELRDGVGIAVEVLDGNGSVIQTASFSVVSFEENGTELNVDAATLAQVATSIGFNENLTHYFQSVSPTGIYGSGVVWKPSSALENNVILEQRQSSFNKGTTSEQFYIHKLQGGPNEYAISSANTGRYLATDGNDKTLRQSGAVSYPTGIADNSLHPVYRFIIRKESNGYYTLNDSDGNPMRPYSQNGAISWRTNATGSAVQYFRIIAPDIEWEVTQLGTEHQRPIFPAAETSFGFNSTLINCGSGNLQQEVGIEKEVTTTYTSALSETIGLSGRVTTSVETSVSATAEASFFGNGGSVTGEVSAGLEVSVEASSSTTVSSEESVSETNSFFSTRTVTVPSGKASLVYDAYQTYSNVRVPFVKRLRLKGSDPESGAPLAGVQIATQLDITNFTGTLLEVGSDYVEISIKGVMVMDNIVDTQTEVRDVASNCGS